MGKLCEGRVVIVTGAGRGIGREHALEFARQGAKLVVNDLGAEIDGTGGGSGPAGEVVEEIRALGGEAIADSKNVLIMHETNHLPVYYFPMTDVRMDLMEPTDHSSH